jgi:hypothetical protein
MTILDAIRDRQLPGGLPALVERRTTDSLRQPVLECESIRTMVVLVSTSSFASPRGRGANPLGGRPRPHVPRPWGRISRPQDGNRPWQPASPRRNRPCHNPLKVKTRVRIPLEPPPTFDSPHLRGGYLSDAPKAGGPAHLLRPPPKGPLPSTARTHVAERRGLHDPSEGGDARRFEALCEPAKQHRSRRKPDVPRLVLEQTADHFAS